MKILLLAKMVVLTPYPIDIEPGRLELVLNKPISAVSEGAALYVNVTSMLPKDLQVISAARHWVEKHFEERVLIATLMGGPGVAEVNLRFDGKSSWSDGTIYLILTSENEVPTGITYESIVIETEVALYGIYLTWKNYSK